MSVREFTIRGGGAILQSSKLRLSFFYRCRQAALTLLLITLGAPATADTLYRYKDADGVLHLSNKPPPAEATQDPGYYARSYGITIASDWRQPVDIVSTLRQTPYPPQPPGNRVNHLYAPLVQAAAAQSQLDPLLLHAVVRVESAYNPNAVSPKGAVGLMQLMPGTAARYGVADSTDPVQNLRGGSLYLRDLIQKFQSLELALAAYNAGEGAVARYGNRIPPYPETQNYVYKILFLYRDLITQS